MRSLAVALLVILSGCLGGTSPDPGPEDGVTPSPAANPSHPAQPAAPPPEQPSASVGSVEGYVRDTTGGVAGVVVTIDERSATTPADGSFRFENIPAGRVVLEAVAQDGRNMSRSVTIVADDSVFVFLDLPEIGAPLGPEPEPQAVESRFICDGEAVDEPFATHGQGDAIIPGLTWAAVKTGFRFAVAVELDLASAATLSYKVGNFGTWTDVASASATDHLFVLENLQEGRDICFRVTAGATSETHAAWLANGHKSFDAASGSYTLNILLLAAEGASTAEVEGGLEYYSQLLWGATDGYVRPGATIVAYESPDKIREALEPCSTPGIGTTAFESLCVKNFDVGITYAENPAAAGSTYLDGIAQKRTWIRLNAVHEANPFLNLAGDAIREFGVVLTHELGHYAFGMGDMYTNSNDCFNAGLHISIMGSNRAAFEFDDKDHPCPNASSISGYVPAWTSLTQRYPEIPQRPDGIDAGPVGDGGAFRLATLNLV